jgi:hypothetical protein
MDHADDIRVKANTAMIMQELGSGIEMTGDDIDKATTLFNSLGKKRTKEEKEECCCRGCGTGSRSIYIQQHHHQPYQQYRPGYFMVISR